MQSKRWIPVVVFLFLNFSQAQDGELEYGLMAGLNLGQFSQKYPGTTSNNRFKAAMIAGGYAQTVLHPQLWLRGEFLYTQKGNRIESTYTNNEGDKTIYSNFLLHYLGLNVTGQYIPVKNLVLYFGPQASYLVSAVWKTSGDTEETSENITNDFKPLEIGVIGGISYRFTRNFEVNGCVWRSGGYLVAERAKFADFFSVQFNN
ncbi:MAG TPA: PorT family protein, partial [Calditrichaeota bacterium]|nr:PorT family protein [Calditrichota bacterium]